MAVNIVIIDGSFGGLTTAYERRRTLPPEQARTTLIAKDPRFVFVPPLPWVAMGQRARSRSPSTLPRHRCASSRSEKAWIRT